MKLSGLLLAAGIVALAAPLHAQQPEISLQIVEMSPASPAVLHKNDRLYLRIRYTTNVPMWIRPEYRDRGARAAKARTSSAGLLDPGKGETLAWVTFTGEAAIDTIHLSASASGRDGFAGQDMAASLRWDGQPSAGESRADWVGPMLASDDARQKQEFGEMEKQLGAGGIGVMAVGVGVMAVAGLVMLAAFAWPIWGVVRWTGLSRQAAAVPLVLVVLWAIKDGVDIARDPTSHNLLPFEFVIGAFFTAPYMLVVSIWRRVRLKGRTNG